MRENVIETRGLTKRFGDFTALDSVSINVPRGEIFGLVGDNGAGKTTLLRMLMGHAFPTGGELLLFGQGGERKLRRARRRLGALVGAPGLFPGMTVEQTLEYYRIQKGIPGKERVSQTLHAVGLYERRHARCKALSTGMAQRLGLAIALIGEPEVLILDEPINGLDPSGIIEMRNLLLALNEERNVTILLSSHILSEMQQIATTYAFIEKGRLVEQIDARTLEERQANHLEIEVSDPEKFAVFLGAHFPNERFKVLPDQTIQIINPQMDPAQISALAAQNGIAILGMRRQKQTLEEHYLNLKKEVRSHGHVR